MAKSLAEIIASLEAELVELKALQVRLNKEAGKVSGKTKKINDWKDLKKGQLIRVCGNFENIVGHKHAEGVYEVAMTEQPDYRGEFSVCLVEPGEDASHKNSPVWVVMQQIINTVGVVEA